METHGGAFGDWARVKTISDKYGEKYNVILQDNEYDPVFKVLIADARFQETDVGYANCLYERDGALMLADIRMRSNAILAFHRTGLFWRFQKVRRKTRSFRQCGLGSELLKCVFAFAKERGIKRIVGKIKALDYSKNPNLPKWYADMGFTVAMEPEQSTVVARISMDL